MSIERQCLVALCLCPTIDPKTIRRLVQASSSCESVWQQLGSETLPENCPIQPEAYRKLVCWRRQFDLTDVSRVLKRYQIEVVVYGDSTYPASLLHLSEPPLVLFAVGDTSLLGLFEQTVAVVGTRRASGYGLEAAAWLTEGWAKAGAVIVSGMAIGIDSQAHRTALQAGGGTIAVLGTGIDVCYPPSNQRLYRQIAEHGLLLTEYAPTVAAAKHRFPERNRLIAALAARTVVIQAGDRSGALRTADIALEMGREVFEVPGPVTSIHHRGSNRLLQEGAGVITEAGDLFRLSDWGVPAEPMPEPSRWLDVYELVATPIDAQRVAAALGRPLQHVYAGLLELELEGWIERLPGGSYQQKRRHQS